MIPTGITREHVLSAIAYLRRNGVPRHRESRDFDVVYEGERFPPKYVIALACEHGVGRKLDSEEFGGGPETNGFLQKLGFTVVTKAGGAAKEPTAASARASRPAPLPNSAST